MVVYSDHQPLQYFMSQPKLSAKQQRWLDFQLTFQSMYSVDLVSNILPDAFSRQLAPPTDVCPYGDACLSSIISEPSWLSIIY